MPIMQTEINWQLVYYIMMAAHIVDDACGLRTSWQLRAVANLSVSAANLESIAIGTIS
jgi:hypothetical protein